MDGRTWVVKSGSAYIHSVTGNQDPELTSSLEDAYRTTRTIAVERVEQMKALGFQAEMINLAGSVTAFQEAVRYLLVRAVRERKLCYMLIGSEAYDMLITAYAESYGVSLPEMSCIRSPAEIIDLVKKGRKS